MATQPTPVTRPAAAEAEGAAGILDRWHACHAERNQKRLVSARSRRMLARWLVRTANRTKPPRALTRMPEPLLHYRAAAVRTDLLELAALLKHAQNPDPARLTALRDLLSNGCDSPLYNADIHISELYATLHYIRTGL